MPPQDSRLSRVLVRTVVGVGLWVVGLGLLAVILGSLGWWTPWLVLPLATVLAVSLGIALTRLPLPPRNHRQAPTLLLVATCLAFGVWAGATHAEQVLPRRDSASNFQAAISLATTHTRVVGIEPWTVGLPQGLTMPGLTLASPAFFAVGDAAHPAIQPQFVVGPAAIYSLGDWLGGPTAIFWIPGFIGALSLLALGLLVSRFLGTWWGAVAAALTGLSFPILHIARSTYSEPLALLTLLAGLLALTLAIDSDRDLDEASTGSSPGPSRSVFLWGLTAGALIGGTAFVRIEGLRETILLLVVAGLGLAQGRRWPRPLLFGAGISTLLAFAAALWLSNQYVGSIARSLIPLVAIGVAMALVIWASLRLRHRGWGLPSRYAARLPAALTVAAALGVILLASRPLWMTVRQDPNDPGARYVAGMQARQGLPIDGGRTYAEQTVNWLSWWLGPITLTLAAATFVVLVHRATRAWVEGREPLPSWTAPLIVGAGSTILTLWRPGITPDHPWAERRLVIALPFAIVLAVVVLRWVWGRHWPIGPSLAPRALTVLLLFGCIGFLVKGTAPLATARVEVGSVAAVEQVCASLEPEDVVLMVDSRAANEWVQVVRGQCGRAALATTSALRRDPSALADTIAAMAELVKVNKQRLVLLSADDAAPQFGSDWRELVDVMVQESEHALEHRPDRLDPLPIRVRLATP